MISSGEEAMSVIMQWSDKGTSLDLNFAGLGIAIIEFDVRLEVSEAWDGVGITKLSDPFEFRFKLPGWTLSPYKLPDGRRGVKMLSREEGVLALEETAPPPLSRAQSSA